MKGTILITLVCFAFTMAFLFICYWLYMEWYKRNKNSEIYYLTEYSDIQDLIMELPVTPKTYLHLYSRIESLSKMKYQDKKLTDQLSEKFDAKFGKLKSK